MKDLIIDRDCFENVVTGELCINPGDYGDVQILGEILNQFDLREGKIPYKKIEDEEIDDDSYELDFHYFSIFYSTETKELRWQEK